MTRTYSNPVYDGYFADPFVLRVGEEYYAYGTGSIVDGRAFEVLRSRDLVAWESVGGALEPVEDAPGSDYWAPEVAYANGQYHLYYSVGAEDRGHLIRVAVCDGPAGPFRDTGVILTPDERFAIDPHPFCDDDGQWYLFYARDLLDQERVGTSLAVDRLIDMTKTEGTPRTVLTATADWQLFKAGRAMYGQTHDWYTLEGPTVRKRHGRYYCLYSGGAWEQPSYGVSYAAADHPLGPWVEPEAEGPTVLATIEDRVIGPGHNSIVAGPDGQDYLVYHAWDTARSARRMCIDRLQWGADGPERSGPSVEPQPAPAP